MKGKLHVSSQFPLRSEFPVVIEPNSPLITLGTVRIAVIYLTKTTVPTTHGGVDTLALFYQPPQRSGTSYSHSKWCASLISRPKHMLQLSNRPWPTQHCWWDDRLLRQGSHDHLNDRLGWESCPILNNMKVTNKHLSWPELIEVTH